MIHHKDLKENLYVCVNCNYHFRMSAEDRIKLFFEDGIIVKLALIKFLMIH